MIQNIPSLVTQIRQDVRKFISNAPTYKKPPTLNSMLQNRNNKDYPKNYPKNIHLFNPQFQPIQQQDEEIIVKVFKNYEQLLNDRIKYECERQGYFIQDYPSAKNMKKQQKQKKFKQQQKKFIEQMKKREIAQLLRLEDHTHTFTRNSKRNSLTQSKNKLDLLDIQQYSNFICQSQSEYRKLCYQVRYFIDKLKIPLFSLEKDEKNKGFFDKFLKNFGFQSKEKEKDKDKDKNTQSFIIKGKEQITQIVKAYFILTQFWFTLPANNNPPQIQLMNNNKQQLYRVICVGKNEQKSVLIYFKEYPRGQKTLINLNNLFANNLMNKLILAQISQKNKYNSFQLQKTYESQMKKKLGQKLIFKNTQIPILNPQKIQLKSQVYSKVSAFTPYYLKQLLGRWANTARKAEQNARTYTFIQPQYIYLTKNILPLSLQLRVDNRTPERYVLSSQNETSFIFQPDSYMRNRQNKKIYEIDMQSTSKRDVRFTVVVVDQFNRQYILSHSVEFQKAQNNLGFSHYISLIPENKQILQNQKFEQFPYILQLQALTKRVAKNRFPTNIKLMRRQNLLMKLGYIPSIYNSYQYYDYTPKTHQIVSEVFYGAVRPTDTPNFINTYLKYVEFCQRQQNQSQNYCQYLKIKQFGNEQSSGYIMRERYYQYAEKLKSQLQSIQKTYFSKIRQSNKLAKRYLQNLRDDLNLYQKKQVKENVYYQFRFDYVQSILQRYILYSANSYAQNANNQYPSKVCYNYSFIRIAMMVGQIYRRRAQQNSTQNYIDQASKFFIAFIQALYPYSTFDRLRKDLLHLRIIAQKYIPQFNYQLNRLGIGLQNYCAQILINFYSNLPSQLCYRIWDLLISNTHKLDILRITSVYTIMLHQQKSNLVKIYPINQIIKSIQVNSHKISIDEKDSIFYNANLLITNKSKKKLSKLKQIAELADQKYLRRFVFGKIVQKQQILDEDNFERKQNKKLQVPSSERIQAKLMSLKQIGYPLPTPGFNGYSVQKICLFVSGVSLLGIFNFHIKKYRLQVKLLGNYQLNDSIQIKDKSVFVNKFIQLNFYTSPLEQKNPPILQFNLAQSGVNIYLMTGRLRLDAFHKDLIYKQNIILQFTKGVIKQQNNFGTSVVNIAFCLKSNNKINEIQNYEDINYQQTIFRQKIFDFDLSPENNQVVKSMSKLDELMKKIMDPLDQLEVQKYLKLKVSTSFRPSQPEWIKNSKTSIEQLKAIFSYIFSEQSQKNIRLNLPKYYNIFAENYQKFDLGKFLLELILMSSITRKKKITMIYCIGCHYQNVYQNGTSQKMTIQTLNSIICQIIKSTGFINACPFVEDFRTQIIYGCYYQKGNKVEENKRQITQILKDWVYIAKIKSGYGGIILGSAHDLSIMRAMLPQNIIKQIQVQPLCRFQIHYKIDEQIFIWSATVNSSDFSIVKRGVKFLNSYPKYSEIRSYLTTIADILYNCQNLIPLECHTSINYDEFQQIFSRYPFLDYMLTYNQYLVQRDNTKSSITEEYVLKNYNFKSQIGEKGQVERKIQSSRNYTDFSIFRHQNCLPSWKKCKIIDDKVDNLTRVQFSDKKDIEYFVPSFEVINLQQFQLSHPSNNEQLK